MCGLGFRGSGASRDVGFRVSGLPWPPRLGRLRSVWGVAPVVEALPLVTPQPIGIHGATQDSRVGKEGPKQRRSGLGLRDEGLGLWRLQRQKPRA